MLKFREATKQVGVILPPLARNQRYIYSHILTCALILNIIHFSHYEYSQSSKPPSTPKRKSSNISASDDEDKSPPRTRKAVKKRQKATISSAKEKGSVTS